ncbi:MAG: hypothetical protein LBS74_08615 [Oscillospiraceae bacterium]|jgi:uncharacterized membrane protein|nr:hypothetical protein [Oscillospiraceae bacterium]
MKTYIIFLAVCVVVSFVLLNIAVIIPKCRYRLNVVKPVVLMVAVFAHGYIQGKYNLSDKTTTIGIIVACVVACLINTVFDLIIKRVNRS